MANMSDRFPVVNGQDLEVQLEQAMPSENKITDRSKAYTVNVAFDHIRDALMQQRQLWEQYAPLYWQKKYHCYQAVLMSLDDSLQEEFKFRMQQEFKRARQLGQLNQADFTPDEWRMINRWTEGAAGKLGAIPVVRKISAYIPKGIKTGIIRVVHLTEKATRQLLGRLR